MTPRAGASLPFCSSPTLSSLRSRMRSVSGLGLRRLVIVLSQDVDQGTSPSADGYHSGRPCPVDAGNGSEHKCSRGTRPSGASGQAATNGGARLALSDVLGDDALVECGDLDGDGWPAKALPGIGRGLPTPSAPLLCVNGGVAQRRRERLFFVGCHEPTALAVADDFGRAVRVAGDHG